MWKNFFTGVARRGVHCIFINLRRDVNRDLRGIDTR
jgi:hypothetical protein